MKLIALLACAVCAAVGGLLHRAASASEAVITGAVRGVDGAPVRGALVRVYTIPGNNYLRQHPVAEGATSAGGEYRVELPPALLGTTVAVGAVKRGFRDVSEEGALRRVAVRNAVRVESPFVLAPALYIAGTVCDDRQKPVEGAWISAPGCGAYLETDADGRFEILNFAEKRPPRAASRRVSIQSSGLVSTTIADVYSLSPDDRASLKVAMARGCTVSGRLADEAGQPIARAMVEADFRDELFRQATVTDAVGNFKLAGLPKQPTVLRCRVSGRQLKASRSLNLSGDVAGVDLRALRWPRQLTPAATRVLGIEVADISPELQLYYDLRSDEGVVVLRDGPGVGGSEGPAEGDVIDLAGTRRCTSVAGLVSGLLDQFYSGSPAADGTRRVQIGYVARRPDRIRRLGGWVAVSSEELKRLKEALRAAGEAP